MSSAASRSCHCAHSDRQTLLGQVAHELEERHPLLAEPVRDGHLDIVEEQFGGVLGVEAHLVEVAASFEASHAVLDHEQGQPCVRIVRRAGRRRSPDRR